MEMQVAPILSCHFWPHAVSFESAEPSGLLPRGALLSTCSVFPSILMEAADFENVSEITLCRARQMTCRVTVYSTG